MNQMPESERIIIFEPYFEKEFSVNVYNSERIQSFIYPGILEPYTTLIDDAPLTGPRIIKMKLSLPDSLPPGVYEIMFGGKEYYEVGGTVGGLAAVGTRVNVLSLYPGLYPDFSFNAYDLGVGEKTNFTVTIENFGTESIQGAYATIEIYDPNNNLVTTLKTNNAPVPNKKISLRPVVVQATFDSSKFDLKPGLYNAIATLNYDGQTFPDKRESPFRLGTLNVVVTDWTRTLYANVTNKFIITIESDWASTIEDVYARVYTLDGTLKTPNLDLNKFQTAQLEAYWEVKKTQLGNQTVSIEVFYGGTSSKKDVIVEIVPPIEPIEEKPMQISPMMIGILVLVLLVAFNIYFFVFKKNNSNQNARNANGEANTGNANNGAPNNSLNNIKPPRI
jgi:hypothetical protein